MPVSIVLPVVTGLMSLIAVGLSIYTFSIQRGDTSYADVDKMYADLLRISLQDPDLRVFDKTATFYKLSDKDPSRVKYETYAFMVWNLMETIYDRQKDRRGRFRLSETWIPAMIEENRLHYTWFKHNLRLFKDEFQRFVTEKLNDINVTEGTLADLDEVYPRLVRDFPPAERLERSRVEFLMSKRRYRLILARHRLFDHVLGYAFIFEPESPQVTWLDYMGIESRFQNSGYGTLMFNKIAQMRQPDNLGVFLEVEPINSEDPRAREDQERRIRFYERLGAKRLDVPYQLPTTTDSLPMHLMFRPSSGVHLLPKEVIREAIASAFEYIHSDAPHRDALYKGFIHAIRDETL